MTCDLFFLLWVPNLFMKRVQEDSTWSLFCHNETHGLADYWGAKFENVYMKYEKEVCIVFGIFIVFFYR